MAPWLPLWSRGFLILSHCGRDFSSEHQSEQATTDMSLAEWKEEVINGTQLNLVE